MAQATETKKRSLSLPMLLFGVLLLAENGYLLYAYQPWAHGLPLRADQIPIAEEEKAPPPPTVTVDAEGRIDCSQVIKPMSILKLDPFIVNLRDARGQRYAKATFQLAFADKDAAALVSEDTLILTPGRQAILDILGEQPADRVVTREGKEILKTDLLAGLNRLRFPAPVVDIYITELLVQF